jgi:hypothetical protein
MAIEELGAEDDASVHIQRSTSSQTTDKAQPDFQHDGFHEL